MTHLPYSYQQIVALDDTLFVRKPSDAHIEIEDPSSRHMTDDHQ